MNEPDDFQRGLIACDAEWEMFTKRIRNKAKRAYAEGYGRYRFGNAHYTEPDDSLSYMGAQAVRLHAEYIWRRVFKTGVTR